MGEHSELGKLNKNLAQLKDMGFNVPDKKHCVVCEKYLDLDQFFDQDRGSFGKHSTCRDCFNTPERSRRFKLKSKYSLTVEEYEELLKDQEFACKVCGITEEIIKGRTNFCVDHDHEAGKIRGLLCNRCNVVLGHVGDDVELLGKMILYLEKYSGQ